MTDAVIPFWQSVFDHYGTKTVSSNDKSKRAYVPNTAQRTALITAGISPSLTKPTPTFPLRVLFDTARNEVQAGFYNSERSAVAARPPEPRMGGEFISSWLEAGDEVLIGNIGRELFSFKLASVPAGAGMSTPEVLKTLPPELITAIAGQAQGLPLRRTVQRTEFIRNEYVILAALLRAGQRCEMPGCIVPLFCRDDGSHYLEVHHVIPLADGGEDTLANVAAVCPACHRELHYGSNRFTRRKLLLAAIR